MISIIASNRFGNKKLHLALSEVCISPLELEKLKNDFGIDVTEHQVKNVIANVMSLKDFLLFCENNSYKQNPSDTGATCT